MSNELIEVEMDESLCPGYLNDDGTDTRFEQTVSFRGDKWQYHAYDADDKFPHAHCYNKRAKIDLGNGNLYATGGRFSRTVDKKGLEELRHRFQNRRSVVASN